MGGQFINNLCRGDGQTIAMAEVLINRIINLGLSFFEQPNNQWLQNVGRELYYMWAHYIRANLKTLSLTVAKDCYNSLDNIILLPKAVKLLIAVGLGLCIIWLLTKATSAASQFSLFNKFRPTCHIAVQNGIKLWKDLIYESNHPPVNNIIPTQQELHHPTLQDQFPQTEDEVTSPVTTSAGSIWQYCKSLCGMGL